MHEAELALVISKLSIDSRKNFDPVVGTLCAAVGLSPAH
jgi:hypothetical protein